MPEKTQRQFNFCIIPEYADGITPPPEGTAAPEAMVFTVADGPAKAAFSGSGQQIGHNTGETSEGLIRKILNKNLPHTNVVRPDDREFVSAMPEAHRKAEKAYHVKAFRGSKEGMLCTANDGIVYLQADTLTLQVTCSFCPRGFCLPSRNPSCSSLSTRSSPSHTRPFYSALLTSMSWPARPTPSKNRSLNSP